MDWIEVVDTAIKIGLGALIAGVFSLIGSSMRYRHEMKISREDRVRNVLEEIGFKLESILSQPQRPIL